MAAIVSPNTFAPPRKVDGGDISSVFPSLSGKVAQILPDSFLQLKREIAQGKEDALAESWSRLLEALPSEIQEIEQKGSNIIPIVDYADIKAGRVDAGKVCEIQRRGAVVIRGVVPADEALQWKSQVQDYIGANREKVTAFPKDDPAVYELYWSRSQAQGRAHANVLDTQKWLLSLWHSEESEISHAYPLVYADRLRIRKPGDAKFALGPHSDGGSLERWQDAQYRQCFGKILDGKWEEYDAFDAKHRISAQQDLYNGAGACSMLRYFQGWLSMSSTAPGEGTLKICPMLKHTTSYLLLRPFFTRSIHDMDSSFPGSVQGAAQEYNQTTHPDLCLERTMCSIPKVEPGDFVAWHCDAIHSVDKEHHGTGDSSVMYIPAVPLTEANAAQLKRQRENALVFSPPPDMPGAGCIGEREFKNRLDWNEVGADGQRAMGLGQERWVIQDEMSDKERRVIERANAIVFPAVK